MSASVGGPSRRRLARPELVERDEAHMRGVPPFGGCSRVSVYEDSCSGLIHAHRCMPEPEPVTPLDPSRKAASSPHGGPPAAQQ
jgi:hypothetical protein